MTKKIILILLIIFCQFPVDCGSRLHDHNLYYTDYGLNNIRHDYYPFYFVPRSAHHFIPYCTYISMVWISFCWCVWKVYDRSWKFFWLNRSDSMALPSYTYTHWNCSGNKNKQSTICLDSRETCDGKTIVWMANRMKNSNWMNVIIGQNFVVTMGYVFLYSFRVMINSILIVSIEVMNWYLWKDMIMDSNINTCIRSNVYKIEFKNIFASIKKHLTYRQA